MARGATASRFNTCRSILRRNSKHLNSLSIDVSPLISRGKLTFYPCSTSLTRTARTGERLLTKHLTRTGYTTRQAAAPPQRGTKRVIKEGIVGSIRKPKGNNCTTDKIKAKAFPEPAVDSQRAETAIKAYRELLFCRCAPRPNCAQGYWNGQHLETSGSGSPTFVVEALSDEKSLSACIPFNELHLSADHGDDSDDTDETEFGVSSQPHMPDPSGGMPDRERFAEAGEPLQLPEAEEPLQLPEAESGAFFDQPSLQKPMLREFLESQQRPWNLYAWKGFSQPDDTTVKGSSKIPAFSPLSEQTLGCDALGTHQPAESHLLNSWDPRVYSKEGSFEEPCSSLEQWGRQYCCGDETIMCRSKSLRSFEEQIASRLECSAKERSPLFLASACTEESGDSPLVTYRKCRLPQANGVAHRQTRTMFQF